MASKKKDPIILEETKFENAREKAKPIIAKFRKAKVAVGDRNMEQMENMAFYEGKQYQLAKYKISRPWVVRMRTPFASTAIDTRVASLIASDYTGVLLPMNPEDEKELAGLSDFVHDEWERLELNRHVAHAIKASAIVREAYVHLVWNSAKAKKGSANREGYAEAYTIDSPSSIYIDPTALCLKEARYMMVLARKTLEELQEDYPEYAKAFRAGQGGFTTEDRGEIYLGKDFFSEQDNVCTVITCYQKSKGIIKKSIVVENVLVEEKELDGITKFPIAQMRWKSATGSPYGLALMDEIIDLQKAINSIESSVTNTAVAYSAPSYGVKKGVGIDPEDLASVIGAPGLILSVEGNPAEAIAPLNMPKLDNAIIGVKQDYIGAIDRIAGITNPYLGSIGTAGNTAQGSKMALERARIIEGDVLENIQEFVESLTEILVEYITTQYSGTTITSRKVDKSTNSVSFKKHKFSDDIGEKDYSFYINMSSKTPYSKDREKEKLVELYQMDNQYKSPIKLVNQLDILQAYDMENYEIMVERYNLLVQQSNEEKTQIIMQITQQAKTLGVPDEMVAPAIAEIIEGGEDTPITDQLMQMLKQKAMEVQAKKQEALAQFQQNTQQAGVAPNAMEAMLQGGQQGGIQAPEGTVPQQMPEQQGAVEEPMM